MALPGNALIAEILTVLEINDAESRYSQWTIRHVSD
jgi:hypothetical protein